MKRCDLRRDLCFRCLKARSICYCSRIRRFAPRTKFAILQHPLERKRTVGSARMAHLCMEDSLLIPGAGFEGNRQVDELIADPAHFCVVLYPGKQALLLESGMGPERVAQTFGAPEGRRLVIFVIDGTWHNAKTMLRRSPGLLRLPQVCFATGRVSEYQFREQPAPHCLSTLESIHHVLELIEPGTDASILLDLFRGMVAEQLEFAKLNLIRLPRYPLPAGTVRVR